VIEVRGPAVMKPAPKRKPFAVGSSPSTYHDGVFDGCVLPRIGRSAQWLSKPSAELRVSRFTAQDASQLTYERCIKDAALAAQIPQALLKVGRVNVVQDSRWNGLWRLVDPNPSAPIRRLSFDARSDETSNILNWRFRTCCPRSAAVTAPP
jgi:hypothetical protein